MYTKTVRQRKGFSLAEILAVVTILGIIAVIVVPRFAGRSQSAKRNACAVNRGYIEVQTQLWYRNNGSWPSITLSDIGADGNYFPDGIPVCPVDGSVYQIDPTTGEVRGHTH